MKQHLLKKALFVLMAMLMVSTKMHAQEPYAVLNDDNTVLTFYYDNQKEARNGLSVGPFAAYADRPWSGVCTGITKVVFDPSFANCNSITSTAYWFSGCNNLTTIVGIENLKTDNVNNMEEMFYSCWSLTSLDVSNFNTVKVTQMGFMFRGCFSLKILDLSNFNTINVENMQSMFLGCSSLTTIYASDLWSTENLIEKSFLFISCTNLVGGQGTVYDSSKTDATYARIDGGAEAPGYFTYKAASGVRGLTRDADLRNAPVYNLRGQRLTAPQRGVNIIGGRKVVVK